MIAEQWLVIEDCVDVARGEALGRITAYLGDDTDKLLIAKGSDDTGSALRRPVCGSRVCKCAIERHRQRDFAVDRHEGQPQCNGAARSMNLTSARAAKKWLMTGGVAQYNSLLMSTKPVTPAPPTPAKSTEKNVTTLAIDIGGSGLKMMLLDS